MSQFLVSINFHTFFIWWFTVVNQKDVIIFLSLFTVLHQDRIFLPIVELSCDQGRPKSSRDPRLDFLVGYVIQCSWRKKKKSLIIHAWSDNSIILVTKEEFTWIQMFMTISFTQTYVIHYITISTIEDFWWFTLTVNCNFVIKNIRFLPNEVLSCSSHIFLNSWFFLFKWFFKVVTSS